MTLGLGVELRPDLVVVAVLGLVLGLGLALALVWAAAARGGRGIRPSSRGRFGGCW